MGLTSIDWIIMAVYSVFVLGIGVALKRYMKTEAGTFVRDRTPVVPIRLQALVQQ
jgi:SSS family solute:Na+ symporter